MSSPVLDCGSQEALEILKSSNQELKKLVGSQAPDTQYMQDFSFSQKAMLAAQDHVASAENLDFSPGTL